MPLRPRFVAHLLSIIAAFFVPVAARASVHFQPVSQEELKMTSEPNAPGAPAIILYREVLRDDCGITCHSTGVGILNAIRSEENYIRIKILTDAGRKYGDIEIPLWKEMESVYNINARTIRPDGSVVPFTGQIFDRTIIKAKGFQYRAKTFAMPDVQVGSILEYYFTISFAKNYIVSSTWILSQDLFTKKAKFSLRPFRHDDIQMNLRRNEHLPTGTTSPIEHGEFVELEAANIAAFQAEDFMPPANELKARVEFIYDFEFFSDDVNKYWKDVGKARNHQLDIFLGGRGAMEQAVSQIVSPSDSPEVKLRKIYSRVQQLHNTTYEPRKTIQEEERDKTGRTETVEGIWKQGSGSDRELNWLYLALVRAAGFEAYGVLAANRHDDFFNPQTMQWRKLETNLVLVKLDGKELYLDPGAAFAPFGMLPWEQTGVKGLKLDKDGGSWVLTNLPDSAASQVQRKANLRLSAVGNLEGKLTVTYTGLEALRRRVDERNQDSTERKKALEDEVKGYIPAGSEVELTKEPEWTNPELPLAAELSLKIPGWATPAGKRALFPFGLFCAGEKQIFDHSQRVYPIYFEFLSQKLDDITVEIPAGWQISGIPKPQNQDLRAFVYTVSAENSKGILHLTRKLDINALSLDTKYYSPLRSFFQMVKAGDDQQIVLLPGAVRSSN